MSKDRRFLDVWIIESNTVYREVPFPVVSDWIQQGRLLENDMLRRSGTAEWFAVGSSPDFTPYLPHSEPDRVEDAAEALEPVELDIRWKRPVPDEDEDVDMIPLIDVSLVLLIFFMLTASTAGLAAFVPTPPAEYGMIDPNTEGVQLNIDLQGEERRPVFSFSVGNKFLDREKDSNLSTIDELLGRLQEYLKGQAGRVEVSINAHPDVKSGLTRELMARLESEPFRSRIMQKYYGVSDKVVSEK
ncbi:MAG TPA: biopolymer transporter ExbD [Terriglobales bacterium]|jgi:biopolymer transport protein ExbD|nr:biopolymer transporter ExbD [Terriglobales bacterium]